ncbi:MAG: type II secretion system F family protein [Patescibacteria group bacterium]|nr:type II secretion system F family protein [Patescibacteria group bacterium]MDE2172493.1 type II secretion system F family protein [Patescibacteria group bacterium]
MSHFIFKAKKSTGETYSGERDAKDRYELYRMLRESGDEIVEFKEKAARSAFNVNISFGFLGTRVKMIEKINFARNLGSMLQAGLPLSRALGVLERQIHNRGFKQIIADILSEIDKGTTFADALARHPKVFPPIFVSMVHAGEQSGTLAEALKVIATQMDSTFSLERRIRGALMYPAVIVTAMILIAILMFIFVVPTLLKTFTDLKVQLPITTQIVLGISTVLRQYGLVVLVILLIVSAAFWWWSKRPSGKRVIHAVILKIPLVGGLVQEVNTARTARTLSSLLGSGVDVVESVSITSEVIQNVHFRRVLNQAAEAIKKGELMSKIFGEAGAKLYPAFFSEMMNVGEETGKTGEMLLGVAHYYEEDVDQKTKDMSTIIEPFLILVIGAAVGFFAVSMITPMYSLVNAIN